MNGRGVSRSVLSNLRYNSSAPAFSIGGTGNVDVSSGGTSDVCSSDRRRPPWTLDLALAGGFCGHSICPRHYYPCPFRPILYRPVHRVSLYRRRAICSPRLPLGAAKHVAL